MSSSPLPPPPAQATTVGVATTGIPGLDDVLAGGFPAGHLYLVEGTPGAGKTTLGLQFLLQGEAQGERGLYLTLSETAAELRAVAASHGWTLDKLEVRDLFSDELLSEDAEQTILHPSEFELGETTRRVMQLVTEVKPQRVVFDSLSDMRLLAQNPLRHRRQILALKRFFASAGATVLLLDDKTLQMGDAQLHSLAHGVLHLDQEIGEYGSDKRRLRVVKLRGVRFRSGEHDFNLERGGLRVFPRLVSNEHGSSFATAAVSTGSAQLDALLGGGLTPGSNLLLSGPAGTGKTTTVISCAIERMRQGEKVAYYLFDERLATLRLRCRMLGLDIEPWIRKGLLDIRVLDPAELSPGEFTHLVRAAVEVDGARMVAIDSLNAYLQAMPGGRHLLVQMHELLSYLNVRGVVTMLVLSQHGLLGDLSSDIDFSYVSDTLLQFRYFEARGRLLKAVSVVKSRTSAHEQTIREFRLGPRGVEIGAVLSDFEGVMAGVGRYTGSVPLLGDDAVDAAH